MPKVPPAATDDVDKAGYNGKYRACPNRGHSQPAAQVADPMIDRPRHIFA
jgi:hypothetical protein